MVCALGTKYIEDAQEETTGEYVALGKKELPNLQIRPFPRKAHLEVGYISRDSAMGHL
jgi:hypothetical protein